MSFQKCPRFQLCLLPPFFCLLCTSAEGKDTQVVWDNPKWQTAPEPLPALVTQQYSLASFSAHWQGFPSSSQHNSWHPLCATKKKFLHFNSWKDWFPEELIISLGFRCYFRVLLNFLILRVTENCIFCWEWAEAAPFCAKIQIKPKLYSQFFLSPLPSHTWVLLKFDNNQEKC